MFIKSDVLNKFSIIAFAIVLNACAPKYAFVQTTAHKNYSIKSNIADTLAAADFLSKYRKTLELTMNQIVGYNDTKLDKAKPNSALGNMVADAMYEAAFLKNNTVQSAVANYGGIRLPSLPKGNITKGQIFELMPFENALVTMQLSGALMDTLCQMMAIGGGWPISNMSFEIKNKKAISIYINNAPIDYSKTYTVALNEYMANGGDNCTFLKPLKKTNCGIIVRDAILNYVVDKTKLNKSLVQLPAERIK
jgi:2',3'-cyclic-nucleotide 2'-phosphodiesterase (5'-nucleotidase family)